MLVHEDKLRVALRPDPPEAARAAARSLLRSFAPQEGYAAVAEGEGPHLLWDELAAVSAGPDKRPAEVTWTMSDGRKRRRGVFCHSPEEAAFDSESSLIFSTWRNAFPPDGPPAALAWRIALPVDTA